METIYLVGQISPKHPETYEWRQDVINDFEFDGTKGVEFINPCGNAFNKKTLKKGKYAVTEKKRSFGIDLLVPKDYSYVLRSSIAMVNMNHYDLEKPLLGSFFELAWYFTHPEKAVIAWADDLNSYQCQHPFVQQAVNVWCNDYKEACYLVKKYFIKGKDD